MLAYHPEIMFWLLQLYGPSEWEGDRLGRVRRPAKQSNVVVYPNPTTGTLTLTVADAQRFDYDLLNISGQSVMRGSAFGSEIQLDLGECPKGVYFVSIRWNGNRLIQKVVVK